LIRGYVLFNRASVSIFFEDLTLFTLQAAGNSAHSSQPRFMPFNPVIPPLSNPLRELRVRDMDFRLPTRLHGYSRGEIFSDVRCLCHDAGGDMPQQMCGPVPAVVVPGGGWVVQALSG